MCITKATSRARGFEDKILTNGGHSRTISFLLLSSLPYLTFLIRTLPLHSIMSFFNINSLYYLSKNDGG